MGDLMPASGSHWCSGQLLTARWLQVGAVKFWGDLAAVGLLYHLYNQVRKDEQGIPDRPST